MPTKTSSCTTISLDLIPSIFYINSVILRSLRSSIVPWSGRSQRKRKDMLHWIEVAEAKKPTHNLTYIHVLGFLIVVGVILLVTCISKTAKWLPFATVHITQVIAFQECLPDWKKTISFEACISNVNKYNIWCMLFIMS